MSNVRNLRLKKAQKQVKDFSNNCLIVQFAKKKIITNFAFFRNLFSFTVNFTNQEVVIMYDQTCLPQQIVAIYSSVA